MASEQVPQFISNYGAPSSRIQHIEHAHADVHEWLLSQKHRRSSDDNDEEVDGLKRQRKVGWSDTEDLTILAAVHRIGTQWQRVADSLPGRTADAVRNRWHRLQKNHALTEQGSLDSSGIDVNWCPPSLHESTHGASETGAEPCIRGSQHGRQMWTPEEDEVIRGGVARIGCKWRQIASLLSGRTDSSVRNRWVRLCREKQSGCENSELNGVIEEPSYPITHAATASIAKHELSEQTGDTMAASALLRESVLMRQNSLSTLPR